MGSLVHSREYGKATAVSVPSFEADLVTESWKCGSRRLNSPFLVGTLVKYIFYRCRTRSSHTSFSHPARTRIGLTNTREIYLSNRCYSSTDEYLPHVPSRVFVHSTNTCPMFLRGYSSMDEYLPHIFEGLFVSRRRIYRFKSGEYYGETSIFICSCPKRKTNG